MKKGPIIRVMMGLMKLPKVEYHSMYILKILSHMRTKFTKKSNSISSAHELLLISRHSLTLPKGTPSLKGEWGFSLCLVNFQPIECGRSLAYTKMVHSFGKERKGWKSRTLFPLLCHSHVNRMYGPPQWDPHNWLFGGPWISSPRVIYF